MSGLALERELFGPLDRLIGRAAGTGGREGTMDSLPQLDARVKPYQDASDRPTKLLAFAELMIGGAFVIKGIRVLKRAEPGADEPFVVFPAEKGRGASSDRWFDLAHPVTAEARSAAIGLILERYRQVSGGAGVATAA